MQMHIKFDSTFPEMIISNSLFSYKIYKIPPLSLSPPISQLLTSLQMLTSNQMPLTASSQHQICQFMCICTGVFCMFFYSGVTILSSTLPLFLLILSQSPSSRMVLSFILENLLSPSALFKHTSTFPPSVFESPSLDMIVLSSWLSLFLFPCSVNFVKKLTVYNCYQRYLTFLQVHHARLLVGLFIYLFI